MIAVSPFIAGTNSVRTRRPGMLRFGPAHSPITAP